MNWKWGALWGTYKLQGWLYWKFPALFITPVLWYCVALAAKFGNIYKVALNHGFTATSWVMNCVSNHVFVVDFDDKNVILNTLGWRWFFVFFLVEWRFMKWRWLHCANVVRLGACVKLCRKVVVDKFHTWKNNKGVCGSVCAVTNIYLLLFKFVTLIDQNLK